MPNHALLPSLILIACLSSQQDVELLEASRRGDVGTVELLLREKPSRAWRGAHDQTALHAAASACQLETAKLLVDAGWQRLARDDQNRTPAMLAMKCPDQHVQFALVDVLVVPAAPDVAVEKNPWSLQKAAAQGNISVLSMLVNFGADVNTPGSEGNRALDITCLKGDAPTTRFLLDHGANPNLRNKTGSTPLHDAALKGNKDVIELLLSHGADVNAVDTESSSTPLHHASSFGRLDAVKALVMRGAEIARSNSKHQNALDLAVKNRHPDVAEYLRSSMRQQ